MRKFLLLLAFLPTLASAQYYGPIYNPANVKITGGTASFTGTVSTTGNLSVQGVVSSANNTSPASTTNSGVAMNWAAPGGADIDLFDSTQTANNRTASILYYQGAMRFRFYNDAHSSALEPIVVTGGQASGVSSIAMTAGTTTISSPSGSTLTVVNSSAGSGSSSSFIAQSSGANNVASIALNNSTAGTDNKWWSILANQSGALVFNAVNDVNNAAASWLTVTRSTAAITGISSNSGSGAWAHTGNFSATGTVSANGAANNVVLTGAAASSAPTIQTTGTDTNVSLAINTKGTGAVSINALTTISAGYTVGTLPTCNTASKGARAFVTDAASPTWNNPVTGSSSNTIPVFCNGNSWVAG